MTYPAGVDISDVADRYEGDLGKFRASYVETLIADAQAVIEAQLPEVVGRLSTGFLSPQMYVKTVAAMVLRVIRNPDGFTYQSAGDSSVSVSVTTSPGEIALTPNDRASLVADSSVRAIGTVGQGIDRGWSGGASPWLYRRGLSPDYPVTYGGGWR